MDQRPDYVPLPKDRCTLTMLTGPDPGALHTVGPGHVILGRDEALPFRILDRGVSGCHARIYCHAGVFWIEDLESTNGTHVNGKRVGSAQRLCDGDRIQLGENTLLRVALQDVTEHEATRRIHQAALLDPLTGVYNRGHLEAVMVAEYAFASRHRTPLALAFIDIDHFGAINNRWGHPVGDAVLRCVAQTIRHSLRLEDFVARYGGEEFVVVARGIDMNGALAMAERVRRNIASCEVAVGETVVSMTASLGVAAFEAATPYAAIDLLIAAADRAVYCAKALGRNRVCQAAGTSEPALL
jgi:diguanylate cyclase (GGDEF)-like protein